MVTSKRAYRSLGLIFLAVAALAGCASTPEPTQPAKPELADVRARPNDLTGTTVNWGGTIARVDNLAQATLLEIVEYPLADSGRPRTDQDSDGRFIARIDGFLDPAVYAEGRSVTVSGTLDTALQRNIGSYPYVFPVVDADRYQLWKPRQPRDVVYYPDPFWGSSVFMSFPIWRYHHRHRH